MVFKDRYEAGRLLAKSCAKFKNEDVVVYALPRGGVVIGFEIAEKLHAPFDLIVARKIGHRDNPEYAIGATTENGSTVYSEEDIDEVWFKEAVEKEKEEASRRSRLYLKDRKRVSSKGKVAIIADDGIATGLTMEVAILEVRKMNPKKIIVAVPVAPEDTVQWLASKVDEMIVLTVPEYFKGAVGSYYKEFLPVEDSEVISIMEKV